MCPEWKPEQDERQILRRGHQRDLERMLTKRSEPVHRRRAVMHGVEAPEHRHAVREPVVSVARELEQQHAEHERKWRG